ncbi:molybdenum cofactor biosynthesis protein [Ignicoccus pacificus DSM 13166]|uniref:Molybdenum cofactor biosynthesis protein n=1 Tax=Ignicoccus pacificus DSM 13166 TaxID=940294 RepID=A0A977K938_9CREN|nr:molybdenum cofactor biosynthesis protein [Ignicoccus pacificus DSM 13166]
MLGLGVHEHERFGPKRVKVGIVVVSDAVYEGRREDISGKLAKEKVSKEHDVVYFAIVPNDETAILDSLENAKGAGADFVLFIGGSGIGPNDKTVDLISPMGKELPGFGELFRYETYRKHGSLAILSRAGLWAVNKTLVAVTPGNPDAVEIALNLLLPVLRHLVVEVKGLRHKK